MKRQKSAGSALTFIYNSREKEYKSKTNIDDLSSVSITQRAKNEYIFIGKYYIIGLNLH